MKKFKKVMAMSWAAVMAVSAMSMSAFATENKTEEAIEIARKSGYTVIENMVDYSVYDTDMVYIQEHADKVAEYNTALKRRASIGSYNSWDWNSNGIYSRTTGSASGFNISYYFTPVNNYLYFNAEITGVSKAPSLAVNKLNSDGTLTYVGSYNVTSAGDETYEWSNYKRSLNKGQNYVFSLWSNSSNWSYSSLDIYKSAM